MKRTKLIIIRYAIAIIASGVMMVGVFHMLNTPQSPYHLAGQTMSIRTNSRVLSLSVAPDGRHLAGGVADGNVFNWDFTSEGSKCSEPIHSSAVYQVSICNLHHSLSGSWDGTVCLYDWQNNKIINSRTIFDGGHGVTSLALDKQKQFALAGASEAAFGTIAIMELPSLRVLREVKAHNRGVWSIVFSSDGRQVVSSSSDGSCIVWHYNSGELKKKHDYLIGSPATCSSFLSADALVAVGGANGELTLLDVISGRQVDLSTGYTGGVNCLQYDPVNNCVLVGYGDYSSSDISRVGVWDCKSRKRLDDLILPPGGPVQAIAISEHRLCFGCTSGSIYTYNR